MALTSSSPAFPLENHARLRSIFDGLKGGEYVFWSEATNKYNCIAYAAGDESNWWQPDPYPWCYWPRRAPRGRTVDVYRKMFSLFGYSACANPNPEPGWQKIALYADEVTGMCSHAARQREDGAWVSKLGEDEDLEHTLEALEGPRPAYGRVALVMRRRSR